MTPRQLSILLLVYCGPGCQLPLCVLPPNIVYQLRRKGLLRAVASRVASIEVTYDGGEVAVAALQAAQQVTRRC